MLQSIDYAGRRIDYAVRRSARRRTIGISIGPDGAVVVAAPRWVGEAQIAGFVREKAAWVLKHQLRLRSSPGRARPVQRRFAPGEQLPLLGEQLALRFLAPASGVPPEAWRAGAELCLRGIPAEHADEEARRAAVRRVLEDWYRRQALDFFTGRAAHYAAQLGLPPSRVSIGSAVRRWGSCNARGGLRFNWRLALAPAELADYVAAHEVAHRVELNHSLRFWRVVARLMPDFKARERRLAELGDTLVL